MACSHRTVSGCLHSHHYPTRSPVLINDKRLEYWFVNLQSGAIQCRPRNYMTLTNVGEYALEWTVFVYIYGLILSCKMRFWRAFAVISNLVRAETSAFTIYSNSYCNSLVDAQWLSCICREWLMLKQGLQLGRVGLICTKPPAHSASQDIRSDWWFVMVAGSVSISFSYPPPHSPICVFAALQGNHDSDTLWERGRQKDLHTKPGRGIYLIRLSVWVGTWVHKHKSYNCLHAFALGDSEAETLMINLDFVVIRYCKHCFEMSRLL